MLYLDYAATAPVRAAALKVLIDKFTNDFANPSSAHKLGKKINKEIEVIREGFIKSLKADKYNFIFTSSATESNNMIIKGLEYIQGDSVFLCFGDHPSILAPSKTLEKRGVELKPIPMDSNGAVDLEKLVGSLNESVKLINLTHVNNLSGNYLDVVTAAKKIKAKFPSVFIHVDSVQGFGKFPLDLSGGEIDSITVSAHKIGGPKGISGLYLLKNTKVSPLLDGGGQEFGLRSGTLAGPLMFSFYEAFKDISNNLEEHLEHVRSLYTQIKTTLGEKIPGILFPFPNGGPYILTMVIPGIPSDVLVRHLEMADIFVASSSACSSKIKGFNPTFEALGIEEKYHKNVIRVSFNETIKSEEVDVFIKNILEILNDLTFLKKR
jgi:cysteine desulfurase